MEVLTKEQLAEAFESGANFLTFHKETVNELNVFPVPDGDTGTNMSMTVNSALKQMNEKGGDTVSDLAKSISRGALMGARGNSGVILSQLYRGFAESVKDSRKVGVKELALALKRASEMTYSAVMKPTEGTILTVAREAADYGLKLAKNKDTNDIIHFLREVLLEAERSLDNTPNLLPVLKEAGVVDAGGKGLVLFMEGFIMALEGNKFDPTEADASSSVAEKTYGYRASFILENEQKDWEEDISRKGKIRQVKAYADAKHFIEIDTDMPGEVLTAALAHGTLQNIIIDNLLMGEFTREEEVPASETERRDYAMIAVSSGEGISELFKSLGVDHIITGGQTMNPSTEDFISGIQKVHAKTVFLFPNNGNIILAAKAAQDVTKDCEVIVIETRSIPEGVTACINFNPELSPLENQKQMVENIALIKTAEVTHSVRDTVIGGKSVREGDIIALSNKQILYAGEDRKASVLATIENLMDEDTSIITLFKGADVEEEECEELIEEIEEKYPDVEVEMVIGDQPIYYYLLALE